MFSVFEAYVNLSKLYTFISLYFSKIKLIKFEPIKPEPPVINKFLF